MAKITDYVIGCSLMALINVVVVAGSVFFSGSFVCGAVISGIINGGLFVQNVPIPKKKRGKNAKK